MDSQGLALFFWVFICIAAYAVIARGAFKAAEPLRDRLIDLAAEISHDPKTSEAVKARLGQALDDVYSGWLAWKLTFVGVYTVLTIPFHRVHLASAPEDERSAHLQNKLQSFEGRWVIATIANSPLAAIIFTIIVLIAVAFGTSFSTISRMLTDRYAYFGHRVHAERGPANTQSSITTSI
jgi:hypothetical protein